MEEWPLIIFTLLVQGSVGLTMAMSLSVLFGRTALSANERHCYLLPPLLVAFIAAAVGLIASTLHLGYPLNAFNALRHVESSWLSREIIFASLYLAAVGLSALLALFFRRISLTLLLAACVLGLVDVFCMGAIYTHSSVATWTHCNTWVMFFGATLSIGATAGLCAFAARAGLSENIRRKLVVSAVWVLIIATALRMLEQLAYYRYLAAANLSQVVTFPHQPLLAFNQHRSLYTVAWIVLIIGIALLSRLLKIKAGKGVLASGTCAIIVAEILLRVVFFSLN